MLGMPGATRIGHAIIFPAAHRLRDCMRVVLILINIALAAAFATPLCVEKLPIFRRAVCSLQGKHSVVMAQKRVVVWFRNDLRVHDNYVIAEASKWLSSNRGMEVKVVD